MKSIAGRLTLWFLVIALIPLGLLTSLLYIDGSRDTQELVLRNLQSIADAKADTLEFIAVSRLESAMALSRGPTVVDYVSDPAAAAAAEGRARDFLATAVETLEFDAGFLYSTEGKLLLRVEGEREGGRLAEADLSGDGPVKATELYEVFDRARTLLQADLSGYQVYKGLSEPAAFVASPVLDAKRAVRGVLVLQLNNRQVFQVFRTYSGLGETGEALVGAAVGDEVVVVANTRKYERQNKNAAFTLRFKLNESERARALQLAVQGDRGKASGVTDYNNDPVVAVWTYLPSFRWGMVVKQDTREAYESIARQQKSVSLLLGLTALGVVLTALVVANSLSRPVQEAARAAQAVAAGDLTTSLNVKAHGETGLLVDSVRTMIEYLRNLIGRVQESSVTLMSTAIQIAATARQQHRTMHEFGVSTTEAAAAVNEISATSKALLGTMEEVADTAGRTAQVANDGQAGLEGIDRVMHRLADATGSINGKLAVISERARNINLVVTTITKVADQTNLLSINAAIEAEKAGEYGLGFLVVAREIRRLADQTAVATLDIERLVRDMQQSVSAGVMEMDKFSEQVRHGVDEAGRLGAQLGEVIGSVRSLDDRFEEVNEGMKAQAQGAEQIREAMARLSDGARQTQQSLEEFNRATEQMREAVTELKKDVSFFSVGNWSPSHPDFGHH